MIAAPMPVPSGEDWEEYSYELCIRREPDNTLRVRLRKRAWGSERQLTVHIDQAAFVRGLLRDGIIRLEDLK